MRRCLALAFCALLGSCGNQTTAGGGSDQPNSLDVLVLRDDGTPAAGAAARWVSGTWNPADTSSEIDTSTRSIETIVDSLGRMAMERPDSGTWHLEIIDTAGRQVAVLDSVLGQVVHLAPAGQWSGFVASKGVVPSHLFLVGTSRSVRIGADRSFHLDWLPAGQFRVLGRWAQVNRELATRYLDVGQSIVDDTLDGDSSEVALMDLARRPIRCALRGIFWDDTVAGKWFTATDVSSRVTPAEFGVNPLSALRREPGRDFLSLSFHVGNGTDIGNLYTGPWAGVGMGVAPDARGLDWSEVTAIRFLARGRGVVRLQLNTAAIDDLYSFAHFSAYVSLTDAWSWHEIKTRELWSQNSRGVSWDSAAKGVHAVAFYAMQTDVQFDIADIRVRGNITSLPDTSGR